MKYTFFDFLLKLLEKKITKKYLLDDVSMVRYGTDYVRTLALYVLYVGYTCQIQYVSFDTEFGYTVACSENWNTLCKCGF